MMVTACSRQTVNMLKKRIISYKIRHGQLINFHKDGVRQTKYILSIFMMKLARSLTLFLRSLSLSWQFHFMKFKTY